MLACTQTDDGGGQVIVIWLTGGTCDPVWHNPLVFTLHEATQQVIGQHAQVCLPVLELIGRHYVRKVQVTCMTSRTQLL